MIDYK